MKLKPGVSLKDMKPQTLMGAFIVDGIYKDFGRPEGVTITSVNDGKHMKGSKHYDGLAFDCRTRYFELQMQHEVFNQIKHDLGSEFDVIFHETHIHVEYDPK